MKLTPLLIIWFLFGMAIGVACEKNIHERGKDAGIQKQIKEMCE